MFKNLLCLLLVALLQLTLLPFYASAENTAELHLYDPYEGFTPLYTADDLIKINSNPSGKFYLANDITIPKSYYELGGLFYNNGLGWSPLCFNSEFTGVFDGRYHSIKNLYASYEGSLKDFGLIYKSSGIIRRVNVFVDFTADFPLQYFSGYIVGICCYNSGIIENCFSDGSISLNGFSDSERYSLNIWSGGICGKNYNNIRMCSNALSANISYPQGTSNYQNVSMQFGGISGINIENLENCYNTASSTENIVSSNGTTSISALSGLVYSNTGNIKNCYSNGFTSGINNNVFHYNGFNCEISGIVIPDYLGNTFSHEKAEITSVSAEQMLLKTTYKGWDFDNIWEIKENESTPTLRKNMRNLSPDFYDFKYGNGTDEHPYIVSNLSQFMLIYEIPSASFKLSNDIYLGDINRIIPPISPANFSGTLDGNGFALEAYTADSSQENTYLFYNNMGVIKNLRFTDISILGQKDIGMASVISYRNDGTISNCYFGGTINIVAPDNNFAFGTITLFNYGTIDGCYSDISIFLEEVMNSSSTIGALVGQNSGIISNCDFYGAFVATESHGINLGGICGKNYDVFGANNTIYYGNLSRCTVSADIAVIDLNTYTGAHDVCIGGLAGENASDITDCVFLGTISLIEDPSRTSKFSVYIGGIAAKNDSVTKVSSCYCAGAVDYNYNSYYNYYYFKIGGLVGENEGSVSGYTISTFKEISGESGTICSPQELTEKTTFTDFDFENTWKISDDAFKFPILSDRRIHYDEKPIAIEYSKLPTLTSYFENEYFDFSDMEINRIMNTGVVEKTTLWDVYVTDPDGYLYYGENLFAVIYDDDEYLYSLPLVITLLEEMNIGDLNADGEVNAIDLTELSKYLLNSNYKTHLVAADTKADSNIDILDLIRLKKMLSESTL